MLIWSTLSEAFSALKAILIAIAGVGNGVTAGVVPGAIIALRSLKELQRSIVNQINTKKQLTQIRSRNKTAYTKNRNSKVYGEENRHHFSARTD